MIKACALEKRFGLFPALSALDTHIHKSSIYGLIGSNGSGKSTFLRLLAGVYQPDAGSLLIDGQQVYENTALKQRIFFLADELYFLPQSTLEDMAQFYAVVYPGFSQERFKELDRMLELPKKKKLSAYSKGMRRQAALQLGLACCPDLLLLDEAFDGLDPVVRALAKSLLTQGITDGGMTVIVTSHNLRELEELCDHVGLLHKGKLLYEQELDALKLGFCKVHAIFPQGFDPANVPELAVLHQSSVGSLVNLIVRGASDDVCRRLQELGAAFAEGVPLTLEEVFIHEMEAIGYDYANILV